MLGTRCNIVYTAIASLTCHHTAVQLVTHLYRYTCTSKYTSWLRCTYVSLCTAVTTFRLCGIFEGELTYYPERLEQASVKID